MLFGLTNTPSAFQHLMSEIFANMLDVCTIIYLDDILIYSDSITEHKKHVRKVLQWLCTNGLYASPTKCVFYHDKVEFLGFILGSQGVQIDNNKVSIIWEWPTPWHLKNVQEFLGFANFYKRFIHGYSRIVTPLTQLLQKLVLWNWSPDCKQVFQELKKAFTQALVLMHWNPDSPIVLETDALDFVLAAILLIYVGKELHPIAFYSWVFNLTKQNYDIHNKELLTIFKLFKKWRHYLEDTPVPVDMVTDHKNPSQTSFGHIFINSLTTHTILMAPKSPRKDLSIDTSHISKQLIMAEILGRLTGNHHGTVY